MDASNIDPTNVVSPSADAVTSQDVDESIMTHAAAATPTFENPPVSDSDDTSDSDEEATPTEWLATSRAKRSTAGNRLNALLQQAQTEEDPEDELALLFAEDENGNEDGGFSDHAAHDSDVQMDSSSDSEQSGAEDDLEGEKVLQKQEKAEKRAKHKKVTDRIPFVKKSVRVDPTAMKPPPPRPKKKSERVSWLPTVEDAPTRASARAATREKQVALHADLLDREVKRLKTVKSMEKANAAREAKKKPAMTQAERLAEAARIEKANKKSLSRWEEAENLREEEQRAKLAALKNRKLDGPVITWWSGWSEWVGDRLSKVGKTLVIEDSKEKASKKRKASEMAEDDGKDKSVEPVVSEKDNTPQATLIPQPTHAEAKPITEATITVPQSEPPKDVDLQTPQPVKTSSPEKEVPSPPVVPIQPLPPRSSVLAPPLGLPTQAPHPPPNFHPHQYSTQNPPPYIIAPPMLDGSAPVPGLGYGYKAQSPSPRPTGSSVPPPPTGQIQTQPQNQNLSNAQLPARNTPPPFGFPLGQHHYHQNIHNSSPQHPVQNPTRPQYPPESQYPAYRPLVQELPQEPATPEPPAITNSAVNYVILQNFDETAIKDKNVQTEILLRKRFQKQSTNKKPTQTLCAITSLPARYRDPTTGLPYANAYAFKELRKLQRGDYKWSKLVGCYVGRGTTPLPASEEAERAWKVGGLIPTPVVARGVPLRFVHGGVKREKDVTEGGGPGVPNGKAEYVSLGQALRGGVAQGGVSASPSTPVTTQNISTTATPLVNNTPLGQAGAPSTAASPAPVQPVPTQPAKT